MQMSESRDVAMPDGLEVTGRRFLRLAAGLAGGALMVSLASACASGAPTAGPPRPAAGATTSGSSTANAVYPTYVPGSTGPKPDSPARGPGYDAGFDKFPTNPAKAMPGDPPGAGGTVNIMSIALFPPPAPLAQNPAWQAVNKALNANVEFDVVTQADYPVKLGTVMAGSNMPDMLYIYAPAGSSSPLAAPNGLPHFLLSHAADLTPYLAGDAAKDFPNLAAIPTPAWKNAGSAHQGHPYLIPIHPYLPGQKICKNSPVWDARVRVH